MKIFSRILDTNQREVEKLEKIAQKINELEPQTKKLKDADFPKKTDELKKRVKNGEALEDLLPESYALVREASLRVLGMRHYDVQLMAGVALFQGKVAEQKTGEGKTLSAVTALYLRALSGKGVHLVTVNDYLARLGAGWNAPVYKFLGMSVGVIIQEGKSFIYDPDYSDTSHGDERLSHLKPVERKESYSADITYGTNNEFGFDYLRDNMVPSSDQMVQRGHYFAIVDEVDSILIDEARTPLIISAPDTEPTQKYFTFAQMVEKLNPDTDFKIDEKLKTANLTEHGISRVEKLLGLNNLYEQDYEAIHHIENALRAKSLYLADRDYIIKDNQVIIVDEFTGRLMVGRRWSDGLHQAVEAKEGVQIQQESKTLATISFQNYFRMYEHLSGMTGTAATEADEFRKIYKLEVVVIPTHRPMVRKDNQDSIYKNLGAKYTAVAVEIEKMNKAGRPVLVGTTSIDKNEFLSELLKRKGISHALLNAKNHEKEAEIISEAGKSGSVTVATNMAGRGVDIKLEKGIEKLGGLYVIGTERHESRRIDNQLRGRSGRQGDPGETRFFVSLEDDLMRIFGGEQVSKVMDFLKMPEDVPIEHGLVSKAIEGAQKKVEGHNFDIRKHTVEYDDVMNQQRQIIYGVRHQVLETAEKKDVTLKEQILEKISAEIANIVLAFASEGINAEKIAEEISSIVPIDVNTKKEIMGQIQVMENADQVIEFLSNLLNHWYQVREKQIGEEIARQMEVFVYLETIDTLWRQHLDSVDDLRAGIGLRGYAGRDPLIEYKKEAFDLFEKLMKEIDYEIVHRIFKLSFQRVPVQAIPQQQGVEIRPQIDIQLEQETPDPRPASVETSSTKVTIERDGHIVAQQTYGSDKSLQSRKLGRNDPCYCGSGKKYKRCHFPN